MKGLMVIDPRGSQPPLTRKWWIGASSGSTIVCSSRCSWYGERAGHCQSWGLKDGHPIGQDHMVLRLPKIPPVNGSDILRGSDHTTNMAATGDRNSNLKGGDGSACYIPTVGLVMATWDQLPFGDSGSEDPNRLNSGPCCVADPAHWKSLIGAVRGHGDATEPMGFPTYHSDESDWNAAHPKSGKLRRWFRQHLAVDIQKLLMESPNQDFPSEDQLCAGFRHESWPVAGPQQLDSFS